MPDLLMYTRLVQIAALLVIIAALVLLFIPSGGSMNDPSLAMKEVEGFLKNPETCTSGADQVKRVAALARYDPGKVVLVIEMNALPKRIDFSVVERGSSQSIAKMTYVPPAGCEGISMLTNG
jgi:hypothetical protein